MRKIIFPILLLAIPLSAGEWETRLSLKNLAVSSKSYLDGQSYLYDLNRLRMDAAYYGDDGRFRIIADNENLVGRDYLGSADYALTKTYQPDLPFEPSETLLEEKEAENRLRLYRVYGDLFIGDHTLSAGLLRVPFGVGKLWTPTDLFNPYDATALETGERQGVFGLHGRAATSDLGQLELIATMDRERSTGKTGFRYKSFIGAADLAVSLIHSEEVKMVGFEAEGNLGDTGAEVRGEGGWFDEADRDDPYFHGIAGIEYGLPDTTHVFTLEAHYNEAGGMGTGGTLPGAETDKHHLGAVWSWQPTPLATLTGTWIAGLDRGDGLTGAALDYSLGNETLLFLAANLYYGPETTELGGLPDALFMGVETFF